MAISVKFIYSFCLLFVVFISTPAYTDNYPPDFSDLAARLSPSVVNISTTLAAQPNVEGIPQFPPGSPFEDFFRDFFEKRGGQRPPRESRPQQAMGSGFIIDEEGIVVNIKELHPLRVMPVSSDCDALYAIEVNRGWFEKNNVRIGDKVLDI